MHNFFKKHHRRLALGHVCMSYNNFNISNVFFINTPKSEKKNHNVLWLWSTLNKGSLTCHHSDCTEKEQEWERVGDVPDRRHQEGQRLCLHPAIPSTSLSASCHHSIIVQMNVKPHVRVTSSSCWSLVCNTDHALWTDLGTSTFTFLSIIGTFFFFYTKTAC